MRKLWDKSNENKYDIVLAVMRIKSDEVSKRCIEQPADKYYTRPKPPCILNAVSM